MNLRNVASCWLYSENILAMHGPMNVKFIYEIYTTFSSKSKFHEIRLSGGDTLGDK